MIRTLQDLPSKWEYERLGSVTKEIKSGFASGKRDENGIVQLRMNNVDVGGKINLEKTLKVPIPKNITDYLLQNGDVLFNNTNSVDLIGKTSIFNDEIIPCTYSNHLTRIRGDSTKVNQKWILYNLISLWKKGIFYRICKRHVGQAGITSKDIDNLRIPVPPLVEQRGIVEVLGTVDACIRLTDAVIERAEELKRGLMQRLLTRGIGHTEYKETQLGKIPKTWIISQLKETGKIVTGTTPSTKIKEYYNNKEYMFISPADLGGKKYIQTTIKKISKKGLAVTRSVPKDSVLVTCIGSTIGKVGMTSELSSTNQQINTIISDSEWNPHFIYYNLVFRAKDLKLYANQSPVPIINKSDFSKIKIVKPSLEEQHEIAIILSTIDKKILEEMEGKNKLKIIKQSLMTLLLSGTIRVELKGDGLHRIGDSREANN